MSKQETLQRMADFCSLSAAASAQGADAGQVTIDTHQHQAIEQRDAAANNNKSQTFFKNVLFGCAMASLVGAGWIANSLHQKQNLEKIEAATKVEAEREDEAPSLEGVGSQLKYTTVQYAGKSYKTLDANSRILLAKAAAKEAGLKEVGLDWKDVYGVIHAETMWIDKTGMGNNGVKSYGLAQFEPGTAKHYGLKNPNDPVQAIGAAARMIKDAAVWSKKKVQDMGLEHEDHSRAMKEGISVFYNTGWRTKKKWTPESSNQLPAATKTHIKNFEAGKIVGAEVEMAIKSGTEIQMPTFNMYQRALEIAKANNVHLNHSHQAGKNVIRTLGGASHPAASVSGKRGSRP